MKIKTRYAVDNNNRLILIRNHRALAAHGRFSIDKRNRLQYWLNETQGLRRQYDLPSKITFTGKWRINKDYDLELKLDETKEQCKGDSLVIKGDLLYVDTDVLAFEVKTLDQEGLLHLQILKLSGSWKADEYSRICFVLAERTNPDTLTLEGSWQINKNQQIIYSYEKTDLKTKTKTTQTLIFDGFWQICPNNRLTYRLMRGTLSAFDFRVQIETPNLYPQQGSIKYRVGIGLRDKRSLRDKIISLYGTWKLGKKLGLSFVMDYGQDRVQAIDFDADIMFARNNKIVFSLRNKAKEDLGINITLTHKFLKLHAAEAFLRLKKAGEEAGIEAGINIPF